MINWNDLRHAAREYHLRVEQENGRAVLYSGPVEVTTLDSWQGREYIYAILPRWFTAKNYDRTQGYLESLHDEQTLYAKQWPLLAAARPLTRHLSGGRPVGLESVFFMRYYQHSQSTELEDHTDELDEIEDSLASGVPEKLWIERKSYGSYMHSELFGVIKHDPGKQHEAIEAREYSDLEEHLPEWYKLWHAGTPMQRSEFEEFVAGEFARVRAEYVARYPALAREWRLEIWNFGEGAPKFSVADYSFERLEDTADTLRGWNEWYINSMAV